ncbi:serine/threonine protein kinase [Geodermatophilus africanus]|uniref:non-specific serine/threonine protein kinase n=1 Tax=Geodermatophilus africanus TaxID=1137993 RepID=A0A1H3KXP2_9ACTN|nr:Stk1 family PASTA domain-containing Ser/Thr kinase [Geodermatophilus africanus]SDY56922.1 serine/threonine protein kinase [Geodermatophilus africanus]
MAEPGVRTLGGRYALHSLLATGGMGQVWRASDALLDRFVAVKVLRSEYTGDPTFLARFRAEAQHTARLVHPNIAALHDYGEVVAADGECLAYLVMELVEGEPLSALLTRCGRLDPNRTLDIVRQTAAALAVAHAAGVVHRDVKPGNVLVGWDGVVKITDFGIAWSASSVPLTRTGQVVGTAHYLSPEQADGGKAGPASDVYALGAITYECLAGRRAFDGESPVQIALAQIRDEPEPLPDDVPEAMRTLVARAMVKDPTRRFPDGAAFRAAADAVRAGRPLAPLPPAIAALPGADPRRRRLLVPVAALLLGVGLGVGALELVGGGDAGTPVPVAQAEAPTKAPVAPVASLLVTAADHVGRPADEVEAELAALGLRVQRESVVRADAPAGSVVELRPVGALEPGDLVTLTVAVAPPAPVVPEPAPVLVEDDDESDEGPGRSDDEERGRDRAKPDNSGRGNGRG